MRNKRTRVIAVYHHPQECGSPYLTFISQHSGKVIDSIDIPEGFYSSGMERVESLRKVYSFTEQICTTKVPTPENYIVHAQYGSPGSKYRYRVTKVEVTGEDDDILHTYNCTIHIDACVAKSCHRYSRSLDTFRQEMESQGFDMTGWCLYRRQHTEYDEFLRAVVNTWKQKYQLVNLIHIG